MKDFRQHVPGALWLKNLTKLAFKQKKRKSWPSYSNFSKKIPFCCLSPHLHLWNDFCNKLAINLNLFDILFLLVLIFWQA